MLRARLGPNLSLRFLLPLGVPDSECREASLKLRRAFTALSFFAAPFLRKEPLALSWGRTPRLDSGVRWPEWDPCRARIRVNRDCGRGREFPSVGDMRKRLKLIHARLAMSGPCPCDPGLSSGLPICLVGPGAHCNNTAQAHRPGMPIIRHQVPQSSRFIACGTLTRAV
ncbi:hypothetical protein Tco_0223301 [Tanacetum coccineum]